MKIRVDLAALRVAAERTDTAEAVVSRHWLRDVADELAELRTVVAVQKTEQVAIAAIEARR